MSQLQQYPALMASRIASSLPQSQTRAPGFYGGNSPVNLPGAPQSPQFMSTLPAVTTMPNNGGRVASPAMPPGQSYHGSQPSQGWGSTGQTMNYGGQNYPILPNPQLQMQIPQGQQQQSQPSAQPSGAGMGSWNGQPPPGQQMGIGTGQSGGIVGRGMGGSGGFYNPGQLPGGVDGNITARLAGQPPVPPGNPGASQAQQQYAPPQFNNTQAPTNITAARQTNPLPPQMQQSFQQNQQQAAQQSPGPQPGYRSPSPVSQGGSGVAFGGAQQSQPPAPPQFNPVTQASPAQPPQQQPQQNVQQPQQSAPQQPSFGSQQQSQASPLPSLGQTYGGQTPNQPTSPPQGSQIPASAMPQPGQTTPSGYTNNGNGTYTYQGRTYATPEAMQKMQQKAFNLPQIPGVAPQAGNGSIFQSQYGGANVPMYGTLASYGL